MAERLGLGLIPLGWGSEAIQAVAREAEAAGFNAIFTAEVNNNALAVAQLMGTATTRIQVGTWIANMYMRHSYACAQGAALIADATGGRFILGLGMSHQPVNRGLGVEMVAPAQTLRQYVTDVRMWLRGEGPATHVEQQPATQPVPLYLAALTSPTRARRSKPPTWRRCSIRCSGDPQPNRIPSVAASVSACARGDGA